MELPKDVQQFLKDKPAGSVELFMHIYKFIISIGGDEVECTKTTIAFGENKRYCYIYQFGKDFISGVLKMDHLHEDPGIFFKCGQVSSKSYSYHFRLYDKNDLNAQLKKYIKLALI